MTENFEVHGYYAGRFVERVINAIVMAVEIVLAIRIVLEFFGASPSSSIVAWIYGISSSLMGPFTGSFANLNVGGGAQLDAVAVLAMIGYAILGWLVLRLLSLIFSSMGGL